LLRVSLRIIGFPASKPSNVRESCALKRIMDFEAKPRSQTALNCRQPLNDGFTLLNKWSVGQGFCDRINWVEIVGS
jgi:hypothetical protein